MRPDAYTLMHDRHYLHTWEQFGRVCCVSGSDHPGVHRRFGISRSPVAPGQDTKVIASGSYAAVRAALRLLGWP